MCLELRQEALQDGRFVLVRSLVTAGSVRGAEYAGRRRIGALCHRGCRQDHQTSSPRPVVPELRVDVAALTRAGRGVLDLAINERDLGEQELGRRYERRLAEVSRLSQRGVELPASAREVVPGSAAMSSPSSRWTRAPALSWPVP